MARGLDSGWKSVTVRADMPRSSRLTHPSARALTLAGLFVGLATALPARAQSVAPPDYRFKFEVLAEELPQPMTLQEAPDGRIFFNEIAGKVKVYDPATRLVSVIGELKVTTAQENGLLGMALDPDFAPKRLDLLPALAAGFRRPTHQPVRLSRWQTGHGFAQGSAELAGAAPGVLPPRGRAAVRPGRLPLRLDRRQHEPFQRLGRLRADRRTAGQGPVGCPEILSQHERSAGQDPAHQADAGGRLHDPGGQSVPAGTPKTRPEIYAMGFRNPWRFNIDPKTGFVYVGDVGPDAGGDREERGPQGFDTVNQLRQAGNYGWPYSRGNRVYVDFDFAEKKPGSIYDKAKPINRSPNNSGLTELPPVQAPLVWYPGGDSEEFPILGRGGRTACGGPVSISTRPLRSLGAAGTFRRLPAVLRLAAAFIHWARLDEEGKLAEILPFTAAARVAQGEDDGSDRFQIRRPVDFIFGKDGSFISSTTAKRGGPIATRGWFA
jgi:cytochrome c